MENSLKIFLAGISLILLMHCSQANQPRQLECWHCSSETIGAEDFCDVTFDEDNIPRPEVMKEHNISVLRNCSSTTHSEHERPVCRKTVEEINGKTITKRFCYYTNKSDSLEHCMEELTENNVKRIFCQDCLTDQCNGGGQQFVSWLSQLLPLVLAKAVCF
ncbi:uncharacterized protein LOC129249264 [Anastrepha obliqua]|uniref:uncharacterized protein LOC128864212 n=1 Tax=Anastrepha ludens TaxID=28586 RepID=UPI0023B1C5EE|nr:uncharacterized protein LOC128864212 [Anastrepha ludens]XP_054744938.1 uncharacterized protein LOC129249264 [Anastrepha obliqua]